MGDVILDVISKRLIDDGFTVFKDGNNLEVLMDSRFIGMVDYRDLIVINIFACQRVAIPTTKKFYRYFEIADLDIDEIAGLFNKYSIISATYDENIFSL